MRFDLNQLDLPALDRLLHAVVVPRPIAWISTQDTDGQPNLAPFSFFNLVSVAPPMVCIGVSSRADGTPKDTARNILATGDFVVNMVSHAQRLAMNDTSAAHPPHVNEGQLAGVAMTPSDTVAPARVADSPVALECRLFQSTPLGNHRYVLLGRILTVHVRDQAVTDAGKPYLDVPGLDLVARMHGGGWYVRTPGDMFQIDRPLPPDTDPPAGGR